MNAHETSSAVPATDVELVARCLAGDREAFGLIVARYQTLICSVAYSASGNLAQSEDVAQETFIAAWKQLARLREPEKLRSWLCGIARNLVRDNRRQLRREPSSAGESTDVLSATPAPEPWPSDQAISREREAILWHALERIPDLYREPLVLFYRQHKSVERVAHELNLSEDAVRQRLARGRKLLHQQAMAFVEGALAHTAPGPMFTLAVMGALPLFASSSLASAAMAGGTAGVSGKLLLVFNIVVGPLLALSAAFLGVRASIADTRTPRERALVKRYFLTVAAGTVLFTIASIPLNALAKASGGFNPAPMAVWLALLVTYVAGVVVLALRLQRQQQRMRRNDHSRDAPALVPAPMEPSAPPREYRSEWTLLGLPLIHISLSRTRGAAARPALGWIAIGDYAFGILFAWGGVAVGAVSGGGLTAGLVSIGAVSLGFLALGGLAIGAYAMGGVAVGVIATGAFSFGWIAAEGRYAVAREFALGVHAAARHANDALADAFFADRPWFDLRTTAGKALLSLVWLPALVMIWGFLRQRRARRHEDAASRLTKD